MKRLFLGFMLIVFSVIVVACKNIPMKPTVSELCSKGLYEAAYNIANDEEKLTVEAENITAYFSRLIIESMIDPRSFDLRNAWVVYRENKTPGTAEYAVQYFSGANEYGGETNGYALWIFNNKTNEWECDNFITGFKPYNSENPTLYESKENLKYVKSKQKVEEIISYDSNLIPLTSIKNINNLFQNEILMKVELIETERVPITSTLTMSPEEVMEAAIQTVEAERSLTQTTEAPQGDVQTPVP